MERDTHTVYTEDYKIFFLSLAQVHKEWDECESEVERMLYLIKNMDKLNKESKPYKTGEYDEVFRASEIAAMAMEDVVAYKDSVLREMEYQSEIDFAKEEAIEEGRKEEKIKLVKKFHLAGVADEIIAQAANLSLDEIRKILSDK